MPTCRCETLPLLVDVGMGRHEPILGSFERRIRRGEPFWWISAYRCRTCGRWWLVASDERINDVFLMRRLTEAETGALARGDWPDDFDRFAEVLRLGEERGHSSAFEDPESPALVETVVDLAREEPGIQVARLASLLQISPPQAQRLAELAKKRPGVKIVR
jgi:hypothetical protein